MANSENTENTENSLYSYAGFSQSDFHSFLDAPSLGRYFLDNVKNGYKTQKLPGASPDIEKLMQSVESSNISRVGYDEAASTLYVEFYRGKAKKSARAKAQGKL